MAAINSSFSRVLDNLARCLHNIPHPDDILEVTICGDGIVQGDEVCDCGGPQVCISELYGDVLISLNI